MKLFSSRPRSADHLLHDAPGAFISASVTNRRRVRVFTVVFALACLVSLAYTFLRPPEYRATLKLQINPGSTSAPAEPTVTEHAEAGAVHTETAVVPVEAAGKPLLNEVQILTSRPLLEQVVKRIGAAGQRLDELGTDPPGAVQSMISVTPLEGTNVVELAAVSQKRWVVATLLNTLAEAYRERLMQSHDRASDDTLAKLREEEALLSSKVGNKRQQAEAFRARYAIVSGERDENQALSQIKGLGVSLNVANEKATAAEARLRSMLASRAAGRAVVRAKDDPTLASLEQRISQMREEMRQLQRSYTADYLAMDPHARELSTKLNELEQQLRVQRETAQQTALTEAQEEAASARAAVATLQEQVNGSRQAVQTFTARFNEYKALQEELTQLEGLQRSAQQQVAKLETSEGARTPTVEVLEAAAMPQESWRPPYVRDAAISVAGSFALALAAMLFVELFNRPNPQPTILVTQPQAWAQALALQEADGAVPLPPARGVPLLPAQHALPRELSDAEVSELILAATEDALLVVVALLAGLTSEEVRGLRREHVDLDGRVIHVPGESARILTAAQPLLALLAQRTLHGEPTEGPLLGDPQGRPLTAEDVERLVVCAAQDACIEDAAAVTPEVLRHTYIAFLVRQGIRFADLAPFVGRLSTSSLAAYAPLSPPRMRVPAEAVDPVLPALRQLMA